MKQKGSKSIIRMTLISMGGLIALFTLAGQNLFIASGSSWSTASPSAQTGKSQSKTPQGQSPGIKAVNSPTEARLEAFGAASYDGGTFIQWRTGFEVDNLGFRLYRDSDGKRTLITPQVLAGSALFTGQGTPLTAGKSYAWWDAASAGHLVSKAGSTYWLEELSIDGQSTWHGPVFAKALGGAPPALAAPAQLAALGLSDQPSHPLAASAKLPRSVAAGAALTSINPIAAQFAVKLSVNHEGWYRVTQPQLLAVGLPSGTNPHNLQLYVDGQPQAIIVNGEADNKLDAADSIEFYAVGLDSLYSNTRVYWLAVSASPGLRISSIPNPAAPVAGGNFPYTIERKDRTIYFSGLLNGDTENFFGAVLSSSPLTQTLSVPHLDATASAASLEVTIQGVSQVSHQVSVTLNGTPLGSFSYFGQAAGVTTLSVPPGVLVEGQNQVVLTAAAGSGLSLIDHLRLTYNHTYTVDSDQLKLSAAAGQPLTLAGFSTNAIRVFDVTNPAAVQEVTGQVQAQGGSFAVSLTVPGTGARSMLALASTQTQAPKQVAANIPSAWNKSSQGADLIILTVRDLFSSVQELRIARQSEGLSVAVVDVEDLYDEFSFGQKTPQAIKDFLALAKVIWKKGARYCVIVGDATFDPKNYLGPGEGDMVPTKLIDTFFMECPSDMWLADFDGDGIEDIGLGRLTVRTGAEAERVIAKILNYDTANPPDELVLSADQNDGYNFEGASMALHNVLPGDVRGIDVLRGQMGTAAAKAALLDGIARGQRVVNYVGHGNIDQWAGNLLTNTDAAAMTNADHLPVFLLMTCLNGYFVDPGFQSLGEELLKNVRGGAVAVWTSTGQTVPEGQWAINQEMYQQMYNGTQVRIGDAVRAAKLVTNDLDVRRTWILFGDPTMHVK